MNDKYVTTGEVAKLFAVCNRTAAKWFDAGLMTGFRLPCGSRDRRFRLKSVLAFAEQYSIPITVPAEWQPSVSTTEGATP